MMITIQSIEWPPFGWPSRRAPYAQGRIKALRDDLLTLDTWGGRQFSSLQCEIMSPGRDGLACFPLPHRRSGERIWDRGGRSQRLARLSLVYAMEIPEVPSSRRTNRRELSGEKWNALL